MSSAEGAMLGTEEQRRWLLGFSALAALSAWTPVAVAGDPRIAAATLPDRQGQLRRLHDPASRATLLDFWASWCTPCKQSFPWMNQLHGALAQEGLRIVAVNLDARREEADRFLARLPAHFEVLFDPSGLLARQLELQAMPTSFFLDARGRIAWRHAGFRLSEAGALEARIRAGLQER